MSAPLLGVDTSHYQGQPDFRAFKSAGGVFAIAKATQGVRIVDAEFATSRANAEAAGLVFGSYGFPDWGDPVAEADFYLTHAAPRPGELVAFDAEGSPPAGVDPVAWALAWCQRVEAAVGCPPIVYMNHNWLSGHNWAPLIANNDGLWLAVYDGTAAQPASGAWPAVAFKQFTDAANEPGVGQSDADYFYGSLAALQKYTVPTSPSGGDMQETDVLTFTRPDNGQTVSFTVGDAIKWMDYYAGDADTRLGGVASQVDAIKADTAALLAKPPVAVDQAGADLIAASLVANPDLQKAITDAATVVTSQMMAELAKRFSAAPQ